jgi:hypothetical protein
MKKRPKSSQQSRYEKLERVKRYTPYWDTIRKTVYARDGYRCRACGRSHCKLNAHHIVLLRVSKSNDMRMLITLCDECHAEIEQKGIKILQSGGHKNDVVRMTYRYLIEKRQRVENARISEDKQSL